MTTNPITTVQEGAFALREHVVTLTTDDLTASATTQTIELLSLPKGSLVWGAVMMLTTAFDDSGSSSLTVQVGDGADPNRFVSAAQVHVDGTEVAAAALPSTDVPYAYATADTVDILFTSGTDDLDTYTAGQLTVVIYYTDPTRHLPTGTSLV